MEAVKMSPARLEAVREGLTAWMRARAGQFSYSNDRPAKLYPEASGKSDCSGTIWATSRWATGSSAETQLAINSGVVPAGADPQVILALSFGGTGNSTATISSAADANRLIVEAKPITMD